MKEIKILFCLSILFLNISGNVSIYSQTSLNSDSLENDFPAWLPVINERTPGYIIMAVKNGEVIFEKMGGSSDLERNIAVSESTKFNIGSLSKQFTAFLILLLEEEHKLSTDDNVSKYLPDYNVFKNNKIKIKHLLSHSSGLREQITMLQLCGWKDDDIYSSADEKYLLLRQKDLNFTPGTMMQYSNTNYFVLALIIEKITGEKFSDYCREKIFIPLNMTTALVADDHRKIIPNKAEAYNTIKENESMKYSPSDDDYGHSSIYCTVIDLKKWADNFNERKIGSNELYKKFFSNGVFDNGKEIKTYGYGWFHEKYKSIPVLWHDGARLGFRSGLIYFPDKDMFIISLCNARDFPYADIRDKIADIILKNQIQEPSEQEIKIIPLKMIEKTEKEIKQFEGLYWDRTGDQLWNIQLKNGSLYADDYMLVNEGEHLFRLKDGENITNSCIKFYKSPGRAEWQMIFTRGREVSFKSDNSFPYEQVDAEKNKSMKEFAGLYYSEELDIKFEIRNTGDILELWIRGYEQPVIISNVFKDYFSSSDFAGILFQRNIQKNVTGFLFINQKANKIVFRKM